MKEVNTTPGKYQVVRSENGCTVTQALDNGQLIEDNVPAGESTAVFAFTSRIEVDDDSAVVREVFKLAPVVGGSGGGGLPKTDYLIYNSDYTEVSGNLDNLEDGSHMFQGKALTSWDIDLPALTKATSMFQDCSMLTTFTSDMPALTDGSYMFSTCRELTTFTSDLPALTKGSGMFESCKLNKESALRVLNSIPAYTSGSHKLTIGIHIDHKTDEEVLAAIDAANAKGWTLTVQWNGTPTAQAATTYGLRKPPIYARVSEIERPDGTTERYLDWGHYVTDPTGYEEFRSVEAAREYFGLPMPEEA